MKVKELAEILNIKPEELINSLKNVVTSDDKITEDYDVSKDNEKKLAKL